MLPQITTTTSQPSPPHPFLPCPCCPPPPPPPHYCPSPIDVCIIAVIKTAHIDTLRRTEAYLREGNDCCNGDVHASSHRLSHSSKDEPAAVIVTRPCLSSSRRRGSR